MDVSEHNSCLPILFPFPGHTGDYIFHSPLHLGWGYATVFWPMGWCMISKPGHKTPLAIVPILFLFQGNTGSYIFKVMVSQAGRSFYPQVTAWRRIAQLYSAMIWVRNSLDCVVPLPSWEWFVTTMRVNCFADFGGSVKWRGHLEQRSIQGTKITKWHCTES